jgi:hypothetical protein
MRKAEEKHPVSESGILFINTEYFYTKSVFLFKLHQTEYKDLWVYLTWHCYRNLQTNQHMQNIKGVVG